MLALLNAIFDLSEYQAIWRHVLLAPLLKGGKGKSRRTMSDHRPIGCISTVAKFLEQILLLRLSSLLANHLSPNQA